MKERFSFLVKSVLIIILLTQVHSNIISNGNLDFHPCTLPLVNYQCQTSSPIYHWSAVSLPATTQASGTPAPISLLNEQAFQTTLTNARILSLDQKNSQGKYQRTCVSQRLGNLPAGTYNLNFKAMTRKTGNPSDYNFVVAVSDWNTMSDISLVETLVQFTALGTVPITKTFTLSSTKSNQVLYFCSGSSSSNADEKLVNPVGAGITDISLEKVCPSGQTSILADSTVQCVSSSIVDSSFNCATFDSTLKCSGCDQGYSLVNLNNGFKGCSPILIPSAKTYRKLEIKDLFNRFYFTSIECDFYPNEGHDSLIIPSSKAAVKDSTGRACVTPNDKTLTYEISGNAYVPVDCVYPLILTYSTTSLVPICDKCQDYNDNRIYTVSGTKCFLDPINHCKLFKDDLSGCQKCNDGYTITSDGTRCVQFPKAYCAKVNNEDSEICDQCETPYVLTQDRKVCQIPLANQCLYLRNDAHWLCKICKPGYLPLQSGQKCIPSTIEHCLSLLNNNYDTCKKCENGYKLNVDKNRCLLNSIERCKYASDVNPSLCAECQGVTLGEDGTFCSTISISGCIGADKTDPTLCAKCQMNHLPSPDRTWCIQSELKNCKVASGFQDCVTCEDGLTLTSDRNECVPSLLNCKTVRASNKAQCYQCLAGYIHNQAQSACYIAVTNCQIPINSTHCQRCKNGFTTNKERTACTQNLWNNCCAFVDPAQPSKCQEVEIGSIITVDRMTECVPLAIRYCANIVNGDRLSCEVCIENYALTLDRKTCVPAPFAKCRYVTSKDVSNKCERCQNGYAFNTDKSQCVANTVTNCLVSNGNVGQCGVCAEGFRPTQDLTRCVAYSLTYKCAVYDNTDQTKCVTCEVGFKSNPEDPTQCISDSSATIEHCDNVNADPFYCYTCAQNYLPTYNRMKCGPKIDFCYNLINQDITKCNQCQGGYIPKADRSACVPATIPRCQFALNSDPSKCYSCGSSQVTTVDRTVCGRAISNCLFVQNSNINICAQCADGFSLNENKDGCFINFIPHCQIVYDYQHQCVKCQSGYTLTLDRRQCVAQVPGCQYVTNYDHKICDRCLTGYRTFLEGRKGCSTNSLQSCLQISLTNSSQCATCNLDSVPIPSREKCFSNRRRCQYYNQELGTCLNCIQGYILDELSVYCYPNTIPNCKYVKNTPSQCNQCKSGYLITNDFKACVASTLTNCKYLKSSDHSKCDTCQTGYLPSVTNTTCNQCTVPYCRYSDPLRPGKCAQCIPGFAVKRDGTQCAYMVSCKYYSVVNVCDECVSDDFILVKEARDCNLKLVPHCKYQASWDGKVCEECETGYGVTTSSRQCALLSINHCKFYKDSDPSLCDTCDTGYLPTKDRKQCISTAVQPTQCLYINKADPTKCDQCTVDNKYRTVNTNVCVQSSWLGGKCNFVEETNADKCVECKPGFISIADYSSCVLSTIEYCQFVNSQGTICETCQSGYQKTEDGKLCGLLIENCENLKNTDVSQCQQCKQGFIPSLDNKHCGPSPTANCTILNNDNQQLCEVCQDDLVPSQDKTECVSSFPHCATLHAGNPAICDSCDSGYTLTQNHQHCVTNSDPECKYYSDTQQTKCVECIVSAAWNAAHDNCLLNPVTGCEIPSEILGKCEKCLYNNLMTPDQLQCSGGILDGCKYVDPSNFGWCKVCLTGYKILENPVGCVQDTITGCKTYLSAGKCYSCETGLIPSVDGTKCGQAIDYCNKLDNSILTKCKQCQDNRKPDLSGQCQVPSNVGHCDVPTSNPDVCGQCASGYVLTSDAKACQVPISIANCKATSSSSGPTVCTECNTNFIPTVDETQCVSNQNLPLCAKADNTLPIECAVCQDGLVMKCDNSGCFVPTISQCKNYTDETTCKECNTNFLPTVDGSKCGSALPGCLLLNNLHLDQCETCVIDYLPKSDKSGCFDPQINQCKTYASETVCQECESGHTLTVDGSACGLSIASCDKLDNQAPTKCAVCTGDLVPNAEGSACVQAPPAGPVDPNCAVYTDSTNKVCLSCKTGFRFGEVEIDGKTFKLCLSSTELIPHCLVYYLDSERYNCKTCNTASGYQQIEVTVGSNVYKKCISTFDIVDQCSTWIQSSVACTYTCTACSVNYGLASVKQNDRVVKKCLRKADQFIPFCGLYVSLSGAYFCKHNHCIDSSVQIPIGTTTQEIACTKFTLFPKGALNECSIYQRPIEGDSDLKCAHCKILSSTGPYCVPETN